MQSEGMNLYRIWQTVNIAYDTYDSAVVCAENEEKAKFIHPEGLDENWDGKDEDFSSWCSINDVQCEEIGQAKDGTLPGIIVSSYNAG